MSAVRAYVVIEFDGLDVPHVAETPTARSMVVSNEATDRSAAVIGMGKVDVAVSDVPCTSVP